MQYGINHAVIEAAAKERWGDVVTSEPYWVDPDNKTVRVGVYFPGFDISFGANFNFVEGKFL